MPLPVPVVHCQPSRFAARDPSSRWANIACSPSRQSAPARTVQWEASHIRVWFTTQPSRCSSSTTAPMQAISRGQGSSGQVARPSVGCSRRSACPFARQTRA